MLAPVVLGAAVLVGAPASAAGTGAVTPFLDCVTVDPQSGDVTAYFGYRNTMASAQVIAVGDNNQIFPESPFQGQPTYFNVGTYPQAFPVTFDPTVFPVVAFILAGLEADASADSPACVSGVTSPPTAITANAAVLTGVVVPSGPDATYSFEYGTTTALGSSTTPQSFTGTQPGLVQAPVTGLAPSTTYYARIDTQTGSISTQGQTVSFTTPAVAPLAISTAGLPAGIPGRTYTTQLTGTGGVQPYLWKVTAGSLPPGFTLNGATGVITGNMSTPGTASFTVTLSDPSLPTVAATSKQLSITVGLSSRPLS